VLLPVILQITAFRCILGSYALLGSVVPRDAFAAAKLREAGAIFIGKANLSEWSGMRGEWGHLKGKVPNGLSERGGQTFSPYYPNAHPSSSSSGSGVATAIGLAAGSLGSETHGSIVYPSSRNNVVGIKPTIGLVSRSGGKVSSDGFFDSLPDDE
jgi:amidase